MTTLSDLDGTKWAGSAELWLDPLGDATMRSECTMSVVAGALHYTWSYEGKAHTGSITLRPGGGDFVDSWHQPNAMSCRDIADAWGLFQIQGEYGPDSDWRWRSALSLRAPTGELVLQMTNVAPWGEESRAVRMVCSRQP